MTMKLAENSYGNGLEYFSYHHRDWVDAMYNTTAIMSGVGGADTPNGHKSQIFASFYTMFIGLFYIIAVTIFVAAGFTELNVFSTL